MNPSRVTKPTDKTPENKANTEGDAARVGELSRILSADPDLSTLLSVWPTLPDPIKAAIKALISSSTDITKTTKT